MTRMNVRRTIKLMADYDCSPLWEPGGDPYPIDPDDLLLTAPLRAQLWAWAQTFDAILNREDPASTNFSSEHARQQFIQQGKALAEQLQAELGPHFEVEYHDRY